MTKKLYLGISGKMGSGKTTLSDGLIKALPSLKVVRVSLAKPIKDIQDIIYAYLGVGMQGEKDRDLLIALGMWGRGKSPDFWLEQAVSEMEKIDADIIICDDVRFLNEANWFKDNGLLMRLEGKQRGDNVDESRADDPTETTLDEFDFKYYINNKESVEESLMSALYAISEHMGVQGELNGGQDTEREG